MLLIGGRIALEAVSPNVRNRFGFTPPSEADDREARTSPSSGNDPRRSLAVTPQSRYAARNTRTPDSNPASTSDSVIASNRPVIMIRLLGIQSKSPAN